MTKKVQKIVDDVTDVLEGEQGFTNLKGTVEQLNKLVAAKRAQACDTAAAETAVVVALPEGKQSAPTTTTSEVE
jgi:hypothetical protein